MRINLSWRKGKGAAVDIQKHYALCTLIFSHCLSSASAVIFLLGDNFVACIAFADFGYSSMVMLLSHSS